MLLVPGPTGSRVSLENRAWVIVLKPQKPEIAPVDSTSIRPTFDPYGPYPMQHSYFASVENGTHVAIIDQDARLILQRELLPEAERFPHLFNRPQQMVPGNLTVCY